MMELNQERVAAGTAEHTWKHTITKITAFGGQLLIGRISGFLAEIF